MAGALARFVKRLSKTDGRKDVPREETLPVAQHEVNEVMQIVDEVSQQNERLQAEKQRLAASVHLLQHKLTDLQLRKHSRTMSNGSGLSGGSFVQSDDGHGSSINSVASNPWIEGHGDQRSTTFSLGAGMDLWAAGVQPQLFTGSSSSSQHTYPPSSGPSLRTTSTPQHSGAMHIPTTFLPVYNRAASFTPSTTSTHLSASEHFHGGVNAQAVHPQRSNSANGLPSHSHGSYLSYKMPSTPEVHDLDPVIAQALMEVLAELQDHASVLGVVCSKGWVEVAKALLDAGADVNEIDQETGFAALHEAVRNKHLDTITALLQYGADPNMVAKNGQTPLQLAVAYDYCSVAALLGSLGANLNARTMHSMSVLHEAAKDGQVDMVKTLLLAGADKESKDQQGRTPLHTAVLYGQVAVVEVLVRVGADIRTKSLRGLTTRDALRQAVAEGRCSEQASAKIQSLLWSSDGVVSRRGGHNANDRGVVRSFRMGNETP